MQQGKIFKITLLRKIAEFVIFNYSYSTITRTLNVSKSAVQKIKRKLLFCNINTPERLYNTSNVDLVHAVYGENSFIADNRKTPSIKIRRSSKDNKRLIPDFKKLATKYCENHSLTKKELFIEYEIQAKKRHKKHFMPSAFMNALNREIKILKGPNVYMHRDHPYGDALQLDWCGQKLTVLDDNGIPRKYPVLVLTFAASYYTFAVAVKDFSTKETIIAIIKGLMFFKVIPKQLVFDNARSMVTAHKIGHEAILNDTFCNFLRKNCIIPNANAPRKANEKSAVEHSVRLVQDKCLHKLKPRTFDSINLRLLALVNRHINKTSFRGSEQNTRKFLFHKYESQACRLIKLDKLKYIEHIENVKVQPNYHIKVKNNYYSVPYVLSGKLLSVDIEGEQLTVFNDQDVIATHALLHGINLYSTINDHMLSSHKAISVDEILYKNSNDILNHAKTLSFEILTYCYALLHRDYDFFEMRKACLYIFKQYAKLSSDPERQKFNEAIRMVVKKEPLNKLSSYMIDKEFGLLNMF